MKTKILGLQRSAVLLAIAVLITAPSLTYAQAKSTTVTVGNTSANPVPVTGSVTVANSVPITGSVTVANPVLQVEVANLDPVRVSGPTPTYGYALQSLSNRRTLGIPAGVVLTDLRIRWVTGDSPCLVELRESVPFGDTGTMSQGAVLSLLPANGQPDELHLVSGIPSDGDLVIFVNGACTVQTVWSGYTP